LLWLLLEAWGPAPSEEELLGAFADERRKLLSWAVARAASRRACVAALVCASSSAFRSPMNCKYHLGGEEDSRSTGANRTVLPVPAGCSLPSQSICRRLPRSFAAKLVDVLFRIDFGPCAACIGTSSEEVGIADVLEASDSSLFARKRLLGPSVGVGEAVNPVLLVLVLLLMLLLLTLLLMLLSLWLLMLLLMLFSGACASVEGGVVAVGVLGGAEESSHKICCCCDCCCCDCGCDCCCCC